METERTTYEQAKAALEYVQALMGAAAAEQIDTLKRFITQHEGKSSD